MAGQTRQSHPFFDPSILARGLTPYQHKRKLNLSSKCASPDTQPQPKHFLSDTASLDGGHRAKTQLIQFRPRARKSASTDQYRVHDLDPSKKRAPAFKRSFCKCDFRNPVERGRCSGHEATDITVTTLDEIEALQTVLHIPFMKIDVEGAELRVLKDTERTIAELRAQKSDRSVRA